MHIEAMSACQDGNTLHLYIQFFWSRKTSQIKEDQFEMDSFFCLIFLWII